MNTETPQKYIKACDGECVCVCSLCRINQFRSSQTKTCARVLKIIELTILLNTRDTNCAKFCVNSNVRTHTHTQSSDVCRQPPIKLAIPFASILVIYATRTKCFYLPLSCVLSFITHLKHKFHAVKTSFHIYANGQFNRENRRNAQCVCVCVFVFFYILFSCYIPLETYK